MELYFYDASFQEKIEQYQITEEQLRYTGDPKESTKLTMADPDRYCVLAIEKAQLVTYFNLHINEGVKPYSDNKKAILLRSFSTDSRFLGKGYATQALKLLPSFIREHFKEINEIVLAVNVGNNIAHQLYKKCSYVDKGERRMGPKGELIMMSYDL